MRPGLGVGIELGGLAVLLAGGSLLPSGLALGIYIIIAEFGATYLVHCPAHYLVGLAVGIRFRSLRVGRSALARALPPSLSGLARLLPVLTLSSDRSSVAKATRGRAALMYRAGTVASCSSALLVALAASLVEPISYAILAWLLALGYLGFDAVFSPKGGDFKRANAALRR